jgi:molecular chaperone DnaK
MTEHEHPTPPDDQSPAPASSPIVGIDLGTTYSLVAVAGWPTPDAPPRIIPDQQGRPLCPSIVRFFDDPATAPIVGYDARDAGAAFPRQTIASVKRLMGRSRADALADLRFLSYEVVEGEHATARVRLPDGRELTPQEVSAHVLAHLRAQASRSLGVDVRRAVITVPAYFDDAQRQATRDAAQLAGLEAVRIVAEPTAAALAYGLGVLRSARAARNADDTSTARTSAATPAAPGARHIVVYDLGGGTFDVSVLRLIPAPPAPPTTTRPPTTAAAPTAPSAPAQGADAFQVLATSGDTRLGGDDFDHTLVDLFTRDAQAQGLLAGEATPTQRQALRAEAERVKIALSDAAACDARVELAPGVSYTRRVQRDEFEALIRPLVERSLSACGRALRDARRQLDGSPISAIVMVGGSTRVPLVRRLVAERFALEPYTALDPDQVVALGAAVQGSVLSGATRDALLLDVVPLSMGIETAHGAFAKLIMRNAPVPARASEMFSTSVDGQGSIKLHVLQGEREMAADCRSLGTFHLAGIPPMPAGIPQVRVEFALDANAVLSVSAVELRSGRRASLQVVPTHGLTRAEVERIARESFTHARQDMARHRIADLIANSRLDLHWIEKQLARLAPAPAADVAPEAPATDATNPDAPALSDAQRAAIDRALHTLRLTVHNAERDWASVDPDEFHRAKETLDRASIPLHELSIATSLRESEAIAPAQPAAPVAPTSLTPDPQRQPERGA